MLSCVCGSGFYIQYVFTHTCVCVLVCEAYLEPKQGPGLAAFARAAGQD